MTSIWRPLQATKTNEKRITIVGAGLAGLTLARALQVKQIPYDLFEKRDRPAHFNHGISLQSSSVKRLANLLNLDLETFRRKTEIGLALLRPPDSSSTPPHLGQSVWVDRFQVENLLREGLMRLRWSSRLAKTFFGSRDNDSLLFNDERTHTVTGPLVATDGSLSMVKRTRLAKLRSTVWNYLSFSSYGRVRRSDFEMFFQDWSEPKPVAMVRRGDAVFRIAIDDVFPSGAVRMSYTYSRPTQADEEDPFSTMPGGGGFSERLYREADREDLPPAFRFLFNEFNLSQNMKMNWLMRSSLIPLETLQDFASFRYLFIGDSSHLHPIFTGNGASEAIDDALDLADVLETSGVNESSESLQAWDGDDPLQAFYADRYSKWEQSVRDSEQELERLHFAPLDSLSQKYTIWEQGQSDSESSDKGRTWRSNGKARRSPRPDFKSILTTQ